MEEINNSLRNLKEENEKLISQMQFDCQEKLKSNEDEFSQEREELKNYYEREIE